MAGEIEGETVKALGAAPVFMGSSEVFEALERGTIDGLVNDVGTVFSRDLQEIVRYGTMARFGAYTVDAYCRADWYAAQPAPLRTALDAAGAALYAEGTDVMLRVTEGELPAGGGRGRGRADRAGSAELAAFREAVLPVQAALARHGRRPRGRRPGPAVDRERLRPEPADAHAFPGPGGWCSRAPARWLSPR